MMTVGDNIFVDTNVLVHAMVFESPWHERARKALKSGVEHGRCWWISRQVIREYAAVMSRPQTFSNPLPGIQLAARIRYLETRFRVAEDGPDVMRCLAALFVSHSFGGRQVHDANIAATMQAYSLHRLLTFNIDDFKRFQDIIDVVEP